MMQGRAEHLIFDDQGKVWQANSLEFRRSLVVPESEPHFVPHVVKSLGLISTVLRRGSVIVTFRPRTVSPVAFASLLYWLSDEPPHRICLALLDGRPRHELYGSFEHVLERLHRLIEARHEQDQPLFTASAVSPGAVTEGSLFRRLLVNWERSNKHLSWRNLSDEVDRRVDRRFGAVRSCKEPSDLVIERIWLRILDPEWLASARGMRLAVMPDRSYGRWVSEAYLSVLRSGRPQVDDVSAKIYWPQTGRLPCEYRRLILPCIDADGRPYVVGVVRLQRRRLPHSIEAA
jgi:hypothetical protein